MSMINETILYNRLKRQLNEALNSNHDIYDWFVIASNGSMNYGLDDKYSDIDSKLLVIPSLHDLVFNKRQNYLHEMLDNKEHVEIKDIALYMKTILKQNINFVETLFAKGAIVNPKYQKYWHILQEHREEIARYDENRACQCMLGMMKQKREQMTKPTPGRQESIDMIGYDAKSFHHLMRLAMFMRSYLNGLSYKECLSERGILEYNMLISAKNGNYYFDDAILMSDEYIEDAEKLMQQYEFDIDEGKKKYVEGLLDGVVYGVICNCVNGV